MPPQLLRLKAIILLLAELEPRRRCPPTVTGRFPFGPPPPRQVHAVSHGPRRLRR